MRQQNALDRHLGSDVLAAEVWPSRARIRDCGQSLRLLVGGCSTSRQFFGSKLRGGALRCAVLTFVSDGTGRDETRACAARQTWLGDCIHCATTYSRERTRTHAGIPNRAHPRALAMISWTSGQASHYRKSSRASTKETAPGCSHGLDVGRRIPADRPPFEIGRHREIAAQASRQHLKMARRAGCRSGEMLRSGFRPLALRPTACPTPALHALQGTFVLSSD